MFRRRFPQRLTGLYVLFGTAWIFLSDWLLALALEVPYEFTWGQHVKGSVFIAVTAVLLYGLTRRYQGRMQRVQDELREERSFTESVLETAGALVLVTDPDGTVVQCNHACERICGCSRQEILGSKVWEIVEGAGEQGEMERVFEELRQSPASLLHVETGWLAADNRRRRIAWTNTALRADDGSLRYAILTGVDVSQLRETMNALRDSEALYHTLVETANDAILTADAETGRILTANRQAEELLGRSAGALVGMHQSELHPPEENERYREIFNDNIGHRVITGPLQVVRPDGTCVPVEISSGGAELSGRHIVHGVFRDISRRMRDEEKLRKLSKVVEYSPDAVMITDADGHIEYCNPRFFQATGYRQDEVLGHRPEFLWVQEDMEGQDAAMWDKLFHGEPWYGEFSIRKKDGERTWWFSAVGPVPDEAGNPTHFVAISEDVGQLKFAERTIERLANYDPVTGLPNRALFRDRLEQALLSAKQQRHALAVMIFDIDRFKRINDTLGTEHGDTLLREVANRLGPCGEPGATLARIGGDEFGVIIPAFEAVTESARCADRILDTMRPLFQIDEHNLYVTCSLGIACYPTDGDTTEDLVAHADLALDQSKRFGGNTFLFYKEEMNRVSQVHLGLLADLREALDREEISVFYQPKVSAVDATVTGAEALARWHHAQHGLLPPGEFVPLAEESGLIATLGRQVLKKACLQVREWRERFRNDLVVSVNLSVNQLRDNGLPQQVREILDECGVPPEAVELEVTETDLMHDPEQCIRVLGELVELGVRIAVDDFGTGYSSLNYLKRFPVQVLKVDQSFARNVATDEGDAAISRAVIALGHSLGMTVTAEGVETEAIRDFFDREGCDELQGFLFGRPIPAERFGEWLQTAASAPPARDDGPSRLGGGGPG